MFSSNGPDMSALKKEWEDKLKGKNVVHDEQVCVHAQAECADSGHG